VSIEFCCPHCKKQLRTPDGSSGQQGECPECNAIVPVPPVVHATAPMAYGLAVVIVLMSGLLFAICIIGVQYLIDE